MVGDRKLSRITLPTGGSISYEMQYSPALLLALKGTDRPIVNKSSYCSGVEIINSQIFDHSGAGYDSSCDRLVQEIFGEYQVHVRNVFTSRSLRLAKRTTSDGGVFDISYAAGAAAGEYDRTIIKSAADVITDQYVHVGEKYFGSGSSAVTNRAWQLGNLVEQTRSWATPTSGGPRTIRYEWVNREFGPGEYWQRGQSWLRDMASYAPALARRIITVDGVTTAVSYSNLTEHGSPRSIIEIGPDPSAGSARNSTRTQLRTYFTDIERGLIDFEKDESISLNPGGSIPAWRAPCELLPASCQ
jgi:hypothetical protein